MTERPDTQDDRKSLFFTYLKKTAKVALTTPIKDTFLFLHMVPEYIGGNDGYAAVFHFPHFPFPLCSGDT